MEYNHNVVHVCHDDEDEECSDDCCAAVLDFAGRCGFDKADDGPISCDLEGCFQACVDAQEVLSSACLFGSTAACDTDQLDECCEAIDTYFGMGCSMMKQGDDPACDYTQCSIDHPDNCAEWGFNIHAACDGDTTGECSEECCSVVVGMATESTCFVSKDESCDFEACLEGSDECQDLSELFDEVCGESDFCELEAGDSCCTVIAQILEADCPYADVLFKATGKVSVLKQSCENDCDSMRTCGEVYCDIKVGDEEEEATGSASALSVLVLLAVAFLRL
jgi:hypothetical protein